MASPVIPNPVTYADITTKMQEVDRDMDDFSTRQITFVQDLTAMINYFVYTLRDVDVAAAIERAADAGEIDPVQGAEIYRKFMDVQTSLRLANTDAQKRNIIESLLRWEPVLRKLPLDNPGYNGLPRQSANPPAGYPLPSSGASGESASSGSIGSRPSLELPSAPTTAIKNTISPSDMTRKDAIIELIRRNTRPTVTTTTGKTGEAVHVYRDVSGRPTAFQVEFKNGGITVSQRLDFPAAGGWRIKPKRKTRRGKVGGYKSRKSKRRTFR